MLKQCYEEGRCANCGRGFTCLSIHLSDHDKRSAICSYDCAKELQNKRKPREIKCSSFR